MAILSRLRYRIKAKVSAFLYPQTHLLGHTTRSLYARRRCSPSPGWTLSLVTLFLLAPLRMLRFAFFGFAWKYGREDWLASDPFLRQARECFTILSSDLCLALAFPPFTFLVYRYGTELHIVHLESVDWIYELLVENSIIFWKVRENLKVPFTPRKPAQALRNIKVWIWSLWESRKIARKRYFHLKLKNWPSLSKNLRLRIILLTFLLEQYLTVYRLICGKVLFLSACAQLLHCTAIGTVLYIWLRHLVQ